MYDISMEQYRRAEVYLEKSLESRPKDPAILNNLAVAQMRQEKLDEAEANVRKALEIYPKAHDAKRTLENILRMKKEAEEKKRLNKLMGL